MRPRGQAAAASPNPNARSTTSRVAPRSSVCARSIDTGRAGRHCRFGVGACCPPASTGASGSSATPSNAVGVADRRSLSRFGRLGFSDLAARRSAFVGQSRARTDSECIAGDGESVNVMIARHYQPGVERRYGCAADDVGRVSACSGQALCCNRGWLAERCGTGRSRADAGSTAPRVVARVLRTGLRSSKLRI